MLRRKLALYTLFYIAGITAGFFMSERGRTAEAAGFFVSVFAAVIFTEQNSYAGSAPKEDRGRETPSGGKHLNINKEAVKRQKTVLIVIFLAGALLFDLRCMSYNAAMSYVHDKNYVRGRVTSVSVRDDRLSLTVRNSEAGPAKVLVMIDSDLGEECMRNAGPGLAKALDDAGLYGLTGAEVEARGQFSELPPAEDPGCFDYGLYMKSKGISIRLRAYLLEADDTGISLSTGIKRSLLGARESFISRFSPDTQGFIRGVIFGDKTEMDEDVIGEFNGNSTGHILAVSGLHIGFLYGLLRSMTSRRRTLAVSLLIISVILLYGEMTMWSPATVRACIVMTVSLCSTHLRRRADLLTSVSLAAFLILTFQPYQLFSSGFQLSFLALAGIAVLTGPVSTIAGEAAAVMLAVQAATLPVVAYTYFRINPLAILINIPVILLASVLVPLCILMQMMQAAFGAVPSAGIALAELMSYALIKMNHLLSFGGSFSIRAGGMSAAVILFLYLAMFGLASEWTRVMLLRRDLKAIIRQGILLMMPVAMLFACVYDTISDDEIVFVSVGQGDCVHIRADGHDVLIDGGGQKGYKNGSAGAADGSEENGGTDEGYNVGEKILMPYLIHGGADAVDIALVTHLHADHYKGIMELAEVFPVGAAGIPVDYRDSPVMQACRVIYIKPDTRIDVADDVSIEVLWPVEISDDPIAADDPNEHNTVYMVHYRGKRIMVTGDLLEADEHDMVEYYRGTGRLKCDILKVAHHGSKSSSCEEFLDAAGPRIAVIQCGRNNFYGHPHKQTLDRLEERGIEVFRTDLSGAVGIDIRRNRISVDLFRKKS